MSGGGNWGLWSRPRMSVMPEPIALTANSV